LRSKGQVEGHSDTRYTFLADPYQLMACRWRRSDVRIASPQTSS